MHKEHIAFTDDEMQRVRGYAQEHGLTDEQAASQMVSDALSVRFKRTFHRPPARVYQLPKRSV